MNMDTNFLNISKSNPAVYSQYIQMVYIPGMQRRLRFNEHTSAGAGKLCLQANLASHLLLYSK